MILAKQSLYKVCVLSITITQAKQNTANGNPRRMIIGIIKNPQMLRKDKRIFNVLNFLDTVEHRKGLRGAFIPKGNEDGAW